MHPSLAEIFFIGNIRQLTALDVLYLMPICPELLLPGHPGIDNDDRLVIRAKTDKPVNFHGQVSQDDWHFMHPDHVPLRSRLRWPARHSDLSHRVSFACQTEDKV